MGALGEELKAAMVATSYMQAMLKSAIGGPA